MRTFIFLSFFICAIASCGTTKVAPQPTDTTCIEFNDMLKNKWKYNAEKKYYVFTLTEKEYNKLFTDKTCLPQLTETQILKLFGSPVITQNSTNITKFYYPITPYFSLQKPQDGQTAIVIEIVNHKFHQLYDVNTMIME